jgi:Phosphodiester glycosidase
VAAVKDGHRYVDAGTEGFEHPADPSFYYSFGIARNPRTMAGVAADDDLLLVTVDGRQPGYSGGLSFDCASTLVGAGVTGTGRPGSALGDLVRPGPAGGQSCVATSPGADSIRSRGRRRGRVDDRITPSCGPFR